MFYAISWFVVTWLLALWSLAAWALHAVAVWSVSNAGALSGTASGVGSIALPDWLPAWVPTELLQAAPALAGGLTVVAWVVWAIGGVLLLLLGATLHLLIALWRRRGRGGSRPNAGPSLAVG